MESLIIGLVISIVVIYLINLSGKNSKTIVRDSRSTSGYGPDKWLNNETLISCPSCLNNNSAKNYFRQGDSKYTFICPKCKQIFEIR
jgi:hypothetical protein